MSQVQVSIENRVARVAINAPPHNILTSALQDELREAFTALRARKDHNAVILESALSGKFSVGADVKEHIGRENVERMLKTAHGLIAEVLRCPVPTIACIDGPCLGGAFELVLACDQIASTPESTFGTPEISLGCFPPAAMVLMPRKLPSALAAELIQSGKSFTAPELSQRGAGLKVASPGTEPTSLIADITATYASLPRGPLVEATRLLRSGAAERFTASIGAIEAVYLERLLSLNDATEGPTAFLAKRKPGWDHSECEQNPN